MRRGSAQRSVEGDVVGAIAGWPRLDVASAFAVGLGVGASPALLARQAVELRIQPARLELGPGFSLLTAFPPVAALILKHVLRRRLGVRDVRCLLLALPLYRLAFFLVSVG